MDEQIFRIRPYTKRELARLYFPDTPKIKTAVTNLRRWMGQNAGMMERLSEAGYLPGNRIFSPRQVRIIVEAFGEP